MVRVDASPFFLGGGFQVAAVVLMVEEIRDQLTS